MFKSDFFPVYGDGRIHLYAILLTTSLHFLRSNFIPISFQFPLLVILFS